MRMMTVCRVAILTAVLSGAAVSAHADGFSCQGGDDTIQGFSFACQTVTESFTLGTNSSQTFSFDGGRVLDELKFDNLLISQDISISAFFVDPNGPEASAFMATLPAGVIPITYTNLGQFDNSWMYFRVEEPAPVQGVDFTDNWHQVVTFFSGPLVNPRMLHDPGAPNFYTKDITEFFDPNPNPCDQDPPPEFCDPAIGGRDDMFSQVTNIQHVVPEPGSMLLVASGIAGWLASRRRK